LLYENFFATLIKTGNVKKLDYQFMQRDHIHPNALGVAKVINDIGPVVRKLIMQTRE